MEAPEIKLREAPLDPQSVRRVNSLLLDIFEYGDYDFNHALSGGYAPDLRCIFFTAEKEDSLIGAAGCLVGRQNPAVAIVGPIGVAPRWQGRGVGTNLLATALDYLKSQQCLVAYLGVRQNHRAVDLYRRAGFETYAGLIMRKFLAPKEQFEKCFVGSAVKIRRLSWGDWPAVMALAASPARMYTFDLRTQLFATGYVEPTRFLSVFPKLMHTLEQPLGFANVLISEQNQTVVGIAELRKTADTANCGCELEFFIHDNFLEHAASFLKDTLRRAKASVTCQCLTCDHTKCGIIESVGGRAVRVLPQSASLGESPTDVVLYRFDDAR